MNLGQRVAKYTVLALIAVGIGWAAYTLYGLWWGTVALILTIFVEGWLLANRFDGDTLSEIIEQLGRDYPIFSVAVGMALAKAIDAGLFGDPLTAWRVLPVSVLVGHWFWQFRRKEAK